MRDGRQFLHKLRAANDGDPRKLRYIITVVYGRRGWRKHELLQAVLPASHKPQGTAISPPVAGSTDTAIVKLTGAGTVESTQKTTDWQQYIPELTSQLKALIVSQNRAQTASIVSLRHLQIKRLDPDIPELNSWFRPMSACRVKNMTKKWWIEVQTKLMPPLPPTEWLHLYDIASGRVALQQRKRRGVDKARSALDIVTSHGRLKAAHLPAPRVREMSARSFQRAYAQLFTYCPIMRHQEGHWMFTWGNEAIQDATVAETLRRELSVSSVDATPFKP